MRNRLILLLASFVALSLPALAQDSTGYTKFEENGSIWIRTGSRVAQIEGDDLVLSAPLGIAPFPGASPADPSFALQLMATFEPSGTPQPAGEVTLLLGSGRTRSYSTMTARPISFSEISYSFRTGVERDFLVTKRGTLALCGQAGIATNAANTSGIFSGCISLIIPVRGGFWLVVRGEAQNAPLAGGTWNPQAAAGFRYQFD